MRVYAGTGDDRLHQYLYTGYLRTCGPDKVETFKKLHPLFRAINQEARTLKVSPEKQEELEGNIGFLELFEKQLERIKSESGSR
jgi:hypothetical protein